MVKWVPYSATPYKFGTFTYEEMEANGQLELDKEDRHMIYAEMSEHEDSTAYKAGLRQGDVIIEMNGDEVRGPLHLIYHAIMAMPGDIMKMKVLRGDEFTGYEELEFEFEIGEKDEKELRKWLTARSQQRMMFGLPHYPYSTK